MIQKRRSISLKQKKPKQQQWNMNSLIVWSCMLLEKHVFFCYHFRNSRDKRGSESVKVNVNPERSSCEGRRSHTPEKQGKCVHPWVSVQTHSTHCVPKQSGNETLLHCSSLCDNNRFHSFRNPSLRVAVSLSCTESCAGILASISSFLGGHYIYSLKISKTACLSLPHCESRV